MEKAFSAGYDPALELASNKKQVVHPSDEIDEQSLYIRRREQDLVDRIISGKETGHYWMFLGSKVSLSMNFALEWLDNSSLQGTGKTTMIYDAMHKIQAEGVAVAEAHSDMEVFRLRLGKALNYEYNEDSQTGLFQRRDPREGASLNPASFLVVY